MAAKASGLAMGFGQAHHARRNRGGKDGCLAAGLEPDEFGRAAADIEHQRAVVIVPQKRRAADRGQPRFLLGGDDVELDAGRLAHTRQQHIGIGRPAAGLGGDGPEPHAGMAADALGTDDEGIHGPRDCGLGQKARLRHALAQPHGTGEGFDHPEAPTTGRDRDQQTAIVGPQIDRRQHRLTVPPPALAGGRARFGRAGMRLDGFHGTGAKQDGCRPRLAQPEPARARLPTPTTRMPRLRPPAGTGGAERMELTA